MLDGWGAETGIHRVPAICWEVEEFCREVEALNGTDAAHALVRGLGHDDYRVADD